MIKHLLVSMILLLPACLQAKLEVSPFFGPHMVLQRDQPLPVWGTASPGAEVTVTFRDDSVTATAGDDGTWTAKLPPQSLGEPAALEINTSNETVSFEDVLVGEVWIASGQSNMEWSVKRSANPEEEIAAADYPQIRLLTIPKTHSFEPLRTFDAQWQVCSPETVGDFSAVAYFFGRKLWQELDVPIGLVCSSWGGTVAEAWTPLPTLKSNPLYQSAIDKSQKIIREMTENPDAEERRERMRQLWLEKMTDLAENPPVPAEAWFDLSVPIPDSTTATANKSFMNETRGLVQVRAGIELTEAQAQAGSAILKLGRIDEQDVAWINGVEVGRTAQEGGGVRDVFREYSIPDGTLRAGVNVVVLQIMDRRNSAGFGKDVETMEIVWPDGDRVSLPSEWEKQLVVDLGLRPRALDQDLRNLASVLYNGMIAPLMPAAFRGVIWYQGESNTARANEYRSLFPDLITSWREAWGQGDFPFYFVQLANFDNQTGWPELREAQRSTLALPNTGMAVAIDIGDPDDIHPRNKQDVGLRLALWALANDYGKTQADGSPIPHSGPLFREAVVEDGQIRLRFDHTDGGLKAHGGEALVGFMVAEDGGEFAPAQARIDGKEIIVSHPDMQSPVDVRYAWDINPEANLTNGSELPASPFRTDSRPFTSESTP
jgi:sialate O-acetylesterase